jgi:hypothetical protein
MGDCICVRRGDGPEGCGICNETGTTPDIAGLCERLKTLWLELSDAHAEPPATARIMNALHQSGDTLERQAAEIERLREALRPFALAAENMDGDEPDTLFIYDSPESAMIDYADLRRARAALTGEDHD